MQHNIAPSWSGPAGPGPVQDFSSAEYWEWRYRTGGDSGAGSQGRLAVFKADFLNALVRDNAVASAIEFGCGDGQQLALLDIPSYVGLDVAPAAIAACRARFAGRPDRLFHPMHDGQAHAPADLALSLDVIYHLVEDEIFADYMQSLFEHASRYVVIYASDADQTWPSQHVRHRRFTRHVARHFPHWRHAAMVPNLYPYDPLRPDDTSFAAFHVYARPHEAVRITSPGLAPTHGGRI